MLNIARKVIGSRFFVPGLILLLTALAIGGMKLAFDQRDAARALAESRQQTIAQLEERVRSDARLIAQRDELIAKQNAGIDALAAAAQQNREVYIRQYAAADQRAQRHDDRAAQLMALPDEHLDELAQCRASRILLEEELTQ